MSRREAAIQRDIKKLLEQNYAALVFKVNADAQRGLPDLLCILPKGQVLFIEVKTETGIVSPLQRRTIKKINEQGAHAMVVRSVAEVISEIEGLMI